MKIGIEIDEISFSQVALADRPEHAAVLGRIFTSWSLIEATVAGLLGLMMHADHRAALAVLKTFNSNFSRVNAVRKIGKDMLDASVWEDFDNLMKEVLAYANERNKIAHSLWGVDKDQPDLVVRIPMSVIPNLVVRAPHMTSPMTEEFLASLRSEMTSFTVAKLEQIEQQGRDVLERVMKEATNKTFLLAEEKQSQARL